MYDELDKQQIKLLKQAYKKSFCFDDKYEYLGYKEKNDLYGKAYALKEDGLILLKHEDSETKFTVTITSKGNAIVEKQRKELRSTVMAILTLLFSVLATLIALLSLCKVPQQMPPIPHTVISSAD